MAILGPIRNTGGGAALTILIIDCMSVGSNDKNHDFFAVKEDEFGGACYHS
jgi:hypothetical protein